MSCQAFSGVLVIFLISNGELFCCPSIQIILNRMQWCLYFLITVLWHTKCFARHGGVSWQRSKAACIWWSPQWLRQWKPTRAVSSVLDQLALGAGYGTAHHLQKVCLRSHLPKINTLLQWGLHRHRRGTHICSENLEVTTCVFSKEFSSGLCTCLVGGQVVSCWTLFRGVCGRLLFFLSTTRHLIKSVGQDCSSIPLHLA